MPNAPGELTEAGGGGAMVLDAAEWELAGGQATESPSGLAGSGITAANGRTAGSWVGDLAAPTRLGKTATAATNANLATTIRPDAGVRAA